MTPKMKAKDAQQGVKLNRVRWVLAISIALAIVALAVVAAGVI